MIIAKKLFLSVISGRYAQISIHKNDSKPYVDGTVSCKVLELEAVKYMFRYKFSKFHNMCQSGLL